MGLEEAILQEVREQGKRRVIIHSYEKDMSLADIAGITEFTIEEVTQIIAAYEAEKQA